MTILTDFYKAVMKRVTEEVPAVLYFDMYNNQFEQADPEAELPFDMPAVFMEFAPVEWVQLGRRRQMGTVNFLLHVASVELGEASNLEDEIQQNANLLHHELLNEIWAVLQNFNGNMVSPGLPFGSICRTGSNIDHNHDGVMVHAIPFRVVLYDEAASVSTAFVPATPDVIIKKDNDLDPDTEN